MCSLMKTEGLSDTKIGMLQYLSGIKFWCYIDIEFLFFNPSYDE